jgi:antitoxin VapB
MGLNIKNAQTEASIRALAARTGESLTDAIETAVREKLSRLNEEERTTASDTPLLERLRPLLDAVAAEREARGDTRVSRELLDELYDEHGLPA